MVDALFSRRLANAPLSDGDGDGGDLACLRPSSAWGAIWRGVKSRCPRCGCSSLFDHFLKPAGKCLACGEDWQVRASDDFPPYIVILLLGHIVAPGMIGLETLAHPPLWVHLAIWLPLVTILGIALIRPVKGGVMALQWWLAEGGEGAGEDRDSQKSPVSAATQVIAEVGPY